MDKVILVTGCSSGIGRHLVTALAQAGYRVAASARRPESLADLPAAMTLPLDVTALEGASEAVDRSEEHSLNSSHGYQARMPSSA